MKFTYLDPQTEMEHMFGGFHCINATGKIEDGDCEKFQRFMEISAPPPRTTIYIDSTGGNVEEALEIGRIIRDGWMSTSIGSYQLKFGDLNSSVVRREHSVGKCISAATLIFLGGRLRYIPKGSKFGVHQFSYKNPSPHNFTLSQSLSAKIARYIVDMGVSPEFLEISSSTPSNSLNLLEVDRLKELNVLTGGQTDVHWDVKAQNKMLYVRGERDSLFGHHKVMLTYSKEVGFCFWAVIEALGREEELTSFGVVEVVLNGEDIRIDISDRCERAVFGIYVNILAQITEEEAKSIAYSDSFGVQIRLSHEAEMFLGISAMATEDGRESLETFFTTLSSKN